MAAFQQMRARMAARGRTVSDTPGAGRGPRHGGGRGGQLGLAPSQRGHGWQGRGWEGESARPCDPGCGEGDETDEYENDSWLVDGELADRCG